MGNEEQNMESESVWDLWPSEFPWEDKDCELSPACLDRPFPDRREGTVRVRRVLKEQAS
jgi:hypothetical protein